MTRIMIGVFFILHGLVHSGLAAAPISKDATSRPGSFFTHPARSWLLRRLHFTPGATRAVGFSLVVLTTLGFVLAGMAALGVPPLAGTLAPLVIVSSVLSLILLGVFWHPWLALGIVIDIAILLLWFVRRM
ncbi:MAG: hypothetical protein NTY23_04320 [Chloroflexi bacterium]|nr:hypothetical protein [Chloroflexota bacterium]